MVARTRYQDDWVLNLYRAMQAAIGQQLKIEYEPPRELTPELAIVLRKLDEPSRHQLTRKTGRKAFPPTPLTPAFRPPRLGLKNRP